MQRSRKRVVSEECTPYLGFLSISAAWGSFSACRWNPWVEMQWFPSQVLSQAPKAALQNDLSNNISQVVSLPALTPQSSSLTRRKEETLMMSLKTLQEPASAILASGISTTHSQLELLQIFPQKSVQSAVHSVPAPELQVVLKKITPPTSGGSRLLHNLAVDQGRELTARLRSL